MSSLSDLIYGGTSSSPTTNDADNQSGNEKTSNKKKPPSYSVNAIKLTREDLFGAASRSDQVEDQQPSTNKNKNNNRKTKANNRKNNNNNNNKSSKSSIVPDPPSVKTSKELKKQQAAQRKKEKKEAQVAWLDKLSSKKAKIDNHNNNEKETNEEDDDDDFFDDFVEMDDDELGSFASSSTVTPWKPNDKWKALMNQQRAFVSTVYAAQSQNPKQQQQQNQNQSDKDSRTDEKMNKATSHPQDIDDDDKESSFTSPTATMKSKSALFSSKKKDSNETQEEEEQEINEKLEVIHASLHPEVVPRLAKTGLLPPREEQLQPRLIRKVIKKRKRGGRRRQQQPYNGGYQEEPDVVEEYQETPEQARVRVAKYDRNIEWRRIRKRWKARRYDYASAAVDVGNAVEHVARKVVEQQCQNEQAEKEYEQRRRWMLEQRRQEQKELQQSQEQEGGGEDEVDDGDKKPAAVVHRKPGEDGDSIVDTDAVEKKKVGFKGVDDDDEGGDGDGDGEDDDGSLDEQQQVLERLKQNTASQEEIMKEQGQEEDWDDQLKMLEEPFEKRMDFWQTGLSRPRHQDLDVRLAQALPQTTTNGIRPAPHEETPADTATDTPPPKCLLAEPKDGLSIKWRQFKNKTQSGSRGTDPPCYFPLPANRIHRSRSASVRTDFLHQRQMRCLAARYLCGGGGSMSSKDYRAQKLLQNRLLRALMTKAGQSDDRRDSCAYPDTHRKQLHLYMARLRGSDFQCYIQHKWPKKDNDHRHSAMEDAAQKLGLLPRRDPSEIVRWAGRSLERNPLRLATQIARNKLIIANKATKVPWAPSPISEECNEDPQQQKEQLPPAEPAVEIGPTGEQGDDDDSVESLLAPTNDGVIADLQSLARTVVTDKGTTRDIPDGGNELVGNKTCNYMHLPGTAPPVPMFPLPPTGVIFGPVDRYAGYHHTSRLDETTVALTISTLVSRMGAMSVATSKTGQFQDDEERKRISDQLQLFVERVPDLHKVNYFKWLQTTKRGIQDLPLVNYYNGIMAYCSFMANGCPLLSKTDHKLDPDKTVSFDRPFKEGEEEDSLYGSSEDGTEGVEVIQGRKGGYLADAGMNKVAERIADYCQNHIGHNGLLRFPQLHLTFGLACLCRKLPSVAAEILSRSLDEEPKPNASHCRTPVELMQQMLEYIEDNNLLEEDEPNLDSEDEAIQAGLLEYWMYEAADVFRQCVKLDPLNVDYHLWYIGSLCSCLLLCSGNRIGSGTRRFPSEWNRSAVPSVGMFDDDGAFGRSPKHEIRSKLPKFEHIREELGHAVHLLLHNARYQKGWAKMHLAISSVLEWKQVMGLLVGDAETSCSEGDDPWSQLRVLHRYHATQWMLHDRSSYVKEYASRLSKQSQNKGDNDALLSLLAGTVERDPSKIDHWRKLIHALGPIGRPALSLQDRMHKAQCQECSRLREMRVVDHDSPAGHNRGHGWWAAERVSWWDSCLLDLSLSAASPRESRIISEAVDRKLEKCLPRVIDSQTPISDFAPESLEEDSLSLPELSWLINAETRKDDSSPPSAELRKKSFDAQLPRTFCEVCSDLADSTSLDAPKFSGPSAEELEILCYKIFITCHIYGVVHPNIEPRLWDLVQTCWMKGKFSLVDGDEWNSLLWLSSRGLNISHIIREGCREILLPMSFQFQTHTPPTAPAAATTTHGVSESDSERVAVKGSQGTPTKIHNAEWC